MKSNKSKTLAHGWIVLDKPKGLTSTQALGRVRRLLGAGKVGHGGTLDPLATGLLPLAFGEATKLIPHIMDGDKEYEFAVRWGEQRDTDDAEGKITATSSDRPTAENIRQILPQFIGRVTQTPPAFSAIKLDGKRAYDIARGGGEPKIAAREVMIHSLELTGVPNQDHATFRVRCGKGMYVRALARDMAARLNNFGHIGKLRRTQVGCFTLAQAITLEDLEKREKQGTAAAALLDLSAALGNMRPLSLTAAEAQRLRAGQGVLIRPQHGEPQDQATIFAEHQGVPVALVEAKAGEFRVVRGFHF
ncbi:MAG: tRNA pseudouridine(55) synthase TruB [Pseudomonadota bacterium]|nr:tRNA pseudouridine(55) synthase TruB [Pseudomonadota bacterium]